MEKWKARALEVTRITSLKPSNTKKKTILTKDSNNYTSSRSTSCLSSYSSFNNEMDYKQMWYRKADTQPNLLDNKHRYSIDEIKKPVTNSISTLPLVNQNKNNTNKFVP